MLCAIVGLTACAQDAGDQVVARVGSATIRQTEVDQWAHAIERGVAPVVPGVSPAGAASGAALSFLIATKWLTGQAMLDGVPVSKQAVGRMLRERREVDGEEFKRHLRATGQTVADVKLEIEAELAAEAIAGKLGEQAARVTPQETLALYRRNPSRFRLGELRPTDLFEHLPSREAASALARRMGAGPRFVRHATNHELLFLRPTGDREQAAVLRAIFSTRPGVVNGPMRFQKKWTLFKVRRIIPPRPLSFAMAQAKVTAVLVAERRQKLLAAYLSAYRRRWIAQTNCRVRYLVQGCRQYTGPRRPEANPFAVG